MVCLFFLTEKGSAADADSPPPAPHSDDDDDSISQVSDFGEADDEGMASDAPSSLSSMPHPPRVMSHHTQPHHVPQQQMAFHCEYPGCIAVSRNF